MPTLTAVPALSLLPNVRVDSSALPTVAENVRLLLDEFLALLTRDVQQQNVPDAGIEVRGTSDPEDETTQILVRLWINGPSDRAPRQYQREFGSRVDEWVRRLSEDRRSLFPEKISFQARWVGCR